MVVVAGCNDVVLPLAVLPNEGRTFEADHEEGREYRVARRGYRPLYRFSPLRSSTIIDNSLDKPSKPVRPRTSLGHT
jgi:hypothetical protein